MRPGAVLRLDASGMGGPLGHTVTKPMLPGSTAVTLRTTAVASAGTPPLADDREVALVARREAAADAPGAVAGVEEAGRGDADEAVAGRRRRCRTSRRRRPPRRPCRRSCPAAPCRRRRPAPARGWARSRRPEVDVRRAWVAGQEARLVVPELVEVGRVAHPARQLRVDGQEAGIGGAHRGDVEQHGGHAVVGTPPRPTTVTSWLTASAAAHADRRAGAAAVARADGAGGPADAGAGVEDAGRRQRVQRADRGRRAALLVLARVEAEAGGVEVERRPGAAGVMVKKPSMVVSVTRSVT